MPFNIGDIVYDMRNINNLDVTQKHIKKGVITSMNSIVCFIKHSDNSVTEVPLEYVASVAFMEPVR